MKYDTIPILKTVKCPNGHLFEIPADVAVGRCPEDGILVATQVNPILYFRIFNNFILQEIGNRSSLLIITPDTLTRIYMTTGIIADANIQYDLFEDATVSDNGIAIPIFNKDRNALNKLSQSLKVFSNPTVTNNGTNIMSRKNPKGLFSPYLTRDITPEEVNILKQNTMYLLNVTALAGTTNVSVGINWLEVS